MLQHEISILKCTDDYTIYKVEYPTMDFLSYVGYQDDIFCYTRDINLLLVNYAVYEEKKLNQTNQTIDISQCYMDIVCEQLLREHEQIFKPQYERGLAEDDATIAFLHHSKRDLCQQAEKVFEQGLFSDKAMYEYVTYVYQQMEDAYELVLPIIVELMERNPQLIDVVKKDIRDAGILDDELIVYRGFNDKNREDGTSYTFDLEIAKFFAKRWDSDGYINKYKVNINDVLAYLDGEKEIVTEKAILIEEDIDY